MTVNATFTATFATTQVSADTLASNQAAGNIEDINTFLMGTGAGQANLVYVKERTVASGANDDIDLNGTGIQTLLGANIAATTLVGLIIVNRPKTGAANTTTLTVGAGTNPVVGFMGGTTPTLIIRPGGMVMLECGAVGGIATITPATGDILRVANSAGAAATYQIGLLMRG